MPAPIRHDAAGRRNCACGLTRPLHTTAEASRYAQDEHFSPSASSNSGFERSRSVGHDVERVGTAESVRQGFYAMSVERWIKHPAAAAISAPEKLLA